MEYDAATTALLEDAYQKNPNGVCQIQHSGQPYEVRFSYWQQVNKADEKRVRRVQRIDQNGAVLGLPGSQHNKKPSTTGATAIDDQQAPQQPTDAPPRRSTPFVLPGSHLAPCHCC